MKYATSLHWVVTQLGVGSCDIYQANTAERWFPSCYAIVAMLFSTLLVSYVTSAVVSWQAQSLEREKSLGILLKYMSRHMVSVELRMQIWTIAKHCTSSSMQLILEDDVDLARNLPNDLRTRLRLEVNFPSIQHHPLFNVFIPTFHKRRLDTFVNTDLEPRHLHAHEELFIQYGKSNGMFFWVAGRLNYSIDAVVRTSFSSGSSLSLSLSTQDLSGKQECCGSFLCDPSLWLQWRHRGTGSGVSEAEVLLVSAAKFSALAKRDKVVQKYIDCYLHYARANSDDLMDVWCDVEQLQEFVATALGQDDDRQIEPDRQTQVDEEILASSF